MRMMSFALTERQLMDGSKTVTRRTGWQNLKPGTRLLAVRKAMGLKPGEKVVVLCEVDVVSVRRERLDAITPADVAAEGFPEWANHVDEFVRMFTAHMRVPAEAVVKSLRDTRMRPMTGADLVTRIEFCKVPGSERAAVQVDLPAPP
jgi:hypothetical protein